MKKTKGFAIICDSDFNISKVLRDDFSLISKKLHNITFLKVIDKTNVDKAFRFQNEIKEHNAAFNWELNLLFPDKIDTCFCTGVKEADKVFIIATYDLQDINQFYNEYKNLFNDQANLLLETINSTPESKSSDIQTNIFNEFTKINNELTDLQRELSKKNIKMEKQQKQLELINRVLRHDLANFFTVIRSAIRIYDRKPDNTLLEEVVNYSMKGIELIRNMKQLESVFEDSIRTIPQNIKKITEKVCRAYPLTNFELKLDDEIVVADEGLESVIDNIIRNSVNHGGTEKIKIESECVENRYILKIADFGKGIPDEIKPKIFDENFKSGSTGNTGLGLYIVQKLMQNYGGSVSVKDNVPKGTIFELVFTIVK